jgi:hypothetical protein
MIKRPSPALVISVVALFVSLGGTGYAAIKITGKNVKDGSLTGKDVKNSSLRTADFKRGDLPAGPRGPQGQRGATGGQGPKGAAGVAGSARAYAHILVNSGGATVDPSRSKGITQANVTRIDTGALCVHGLPFTPRNGAGAADANQVQLVVVSIGFAPDAGVIGACGSSAQAVIAISTTGNSPAGADHAIYVELN